MKAHNNALEQYKDSKKRRGTASLEEVAHKVAWAAVKERYEKDEKTGKWKQKMEKKMEFLLFLIQPRCGKNRASEIALQIETQQTEGCTRFHEQR